MPRRYKTVVLEKPYDTYQDSKFVREMLARVWKLKFDGYRAYYPYGVMPVGEMDFFANHVLICEDYHGELIPLAASKSISTNVCQSLNIDFPIFEHVFKGCEEASKEHIKATRQWIDERTKRGENVGYNASWTISPAIKDEPETKRLMLELSMAMYYFYYTTQGIDHIITSASKTFKVDRIQKEMGFEYLKLESKVLDTYPAHLYNDMPFYIMTLNENKFPDFFVHKALKNEEFWSDRIHIRGDLESLHKNKSAA